MNVVINGTQSEVADRTTLDQIVLSLVEDQQRRGLAVALNGEVVPRHGWTAVRIAEGDRVEVLRAVGGG